MLLCACGASAPPPATHAHFQAIQRHEATIDEAAIPAAGPTCDEACPAIAEACAAAARVCDIAGSVTDRDATARCEAARERCAQLEARPDCECP